ncbi:farnesol dehydrogenase [Drosophila innubila]|uniref:farnesol dehydrogenase n=1 Tax=Drosophila innubila TaxID=198719 RepID=UPI00148C5582|nr:farnesol dehydrogenase [Drosophila innubila]XP_034473256.1 farnesol dehydrogenase [Drosophila innubila]XP_034473264.1 farnesol dehydrogenase [Drosophila innubila]XP_034473271.1 farnesol dehydrogenase [Drosophila innubila]XP_034473279.1 farnesol dehydrogenase [Drosophila innubila]XP_034473285.1 farnesol dehydrogenase [Drosophila innubila]XP_034473293.1 farnesol dehydrogenase [Drosophila innubila]XP_034473301.1 farnesol dehydrogenase [Drosophila innubila]XP_034473309.1 farnesol dehydrogena
MNRWSNRVAVVTGASSGIGAACCKDLVAKGMVVVGLARRENRLEEIKAALPADQAARFHYHKCDVSDEKQVIETFAWIEKTLGGADVLVNNAGISRHTTLTGEGNSADLRAVLDTNVLGVSWCTREAFNSMQRRKIDDGHIVIINSIAGHRVPILPGMSFNMYAPSKHAITALTEVLRQEFLAKGTKTKITSISPGAVDTEIIDKNAFTKLGDFPLLLAEDVADAVSYCIQTPPNVQIHELTIKPVGEKF